MSSNYAMQQYFTNLRGMQTLILSMAPPDTPELNMSILQQQGVPTTSAPSENSSYTSPLKGLSSQWKQPSLQDQHLTGIAALASANIPQNPNEADKPELQRQDSGITPNTGPEEVFKYPTSKPSDAPRLGQDRPEKDGPQSQLPSISTALDQHKTSMFGASGSPQSASSMGPSGFTPTPVSATRPDSAFPLSATSPLAPNNFLSAQTPTSPFSALPTPTSATSTTAPGGTPGSSRGRHICPHCNQAFTRVHNLKSHLLTHSKSKPYDCNACPAKFRRLHDLKRHSRLHTGERPHECPKCGRRFARGDALARHARGEAGCAGRRSSVAGEGGPFDDEDGFGDYGDGEGEDTMMVDASVTTPTQPTSATGSDSERRRASLPSIRTTDLSRGANPPTPGYLQHHPTYPPATPSTAQSARKNPLGRSPGKSNLPPHHQQPTPSSATPTGPSSIAHLHSTSLMTPTLTSSPRPLSPPQAPIAPTIASQVQGLQGVGSQTLHGQPTPVSAQPGVGQWKEVGEWGYVRQLEERVRELEAKVRGLEERLGRVEGR